MNEVSAIRQQVQDDFRRTVPGFLSAAGVPQLRFDKKLPTAEPVFILTGASFTAHDAGLHGDDPAHCHYSCPPTDDRSYMMNNTAALLEKLMDEGRRVVVHSAAPAETKSIIAAHPGNARVTVIGGELGQPGFLKSTYRALEDMADVQPISDVRMALYQSFAQGSGLPFKPMHEERVEDVERAASRRLRFVYNMAAMSYDFLANKNLQSLRIISLSALAANRATYGLIADAADKFMNELAWRTFHHEANILTGRPVAVYQINPGITAACDIYHRHAVRDLVHAESVADGFPLDDNVLRGDAPLPALSARDVAWVCHALLTTPDGEDPNHDMPDNVRTLLYGGFGPEELRRRFNMALRFDENSIAVDPDRVFPEHIMTPGTSYGALPRLQPSDYKRISLCPPGQYF